LFDEKAGEWFFSCVCCAENKKESARSKKQCDKKGDKIKGAYCSSVINIHKK